MDLSPSAGGVALSRRPDVAQPRDVKRRLPWVGGYLVDSPLAVAWRLQVIRTVVEVSGHTAFKPYPKSVAGRRTVLLPSWLIVIIAYRIATYSPSVEQLVFANTVGCRCAAPCSGDASGNQRSYGPALTQPCDSMILGTQCHLARGRRRPGEPGAACDGSRAVLDHAGSLHPP